MDSQLQLLDLEEVARRLGTSKMTARRLVLSGEIAAFKVSSRIKVPPESVSAYLAAHRYQTKP